MISLHLPDEAYQLAAKYDLGEPIRVYCTNKRNDFKIYAWAITIPCLFIIIVALTQTPHPFHFTHVTILICSLIVGIMLFVALLFFIPLLLMRKTTVYICSDGFIEHHKYYRVVHWEDIEYVMLNNERYIIYLVNKKYMILNKFIEHVEALAQEIEMKARLIKRPEGRGTLEVQFEHLLSSQVAREQEKYERLQGKQMLSEEETSGEVFRLQEEYRLGERMATYYGGLRGILGKKAVGLSIYYLLLLAWVLHFIEEIFRFYVTPEEILLGFIVLFLLSSLFMPRFFARFIQIHLYVEGFIYIDSSSCEVVRWEQIEKIIYHKTMPIFLPPFCHLYLTNGDTLIVSSYIHGLKEVKQLFDEHVVNKVQVG